MGLPEVGWEKVDEENVGMEFRGTLWWALASPRGLVGSLSSAVCLGH